MLLETAVRLGEDLLETVVEDLPRAPRVLRGMAARKRGLLPRARYSAIERRTSAAGAGSATRSASRSSRREPEPALPGLTAERAPAPDTT